MSRSNPGRRHAWMHPWSRLFIVNDGRETQKLTSVVKVDLPIPLFLTLFQTYRLIVISLFQLYFDSERPKLLASFYMFFSSVQMDWYIAINATLTRDLDANLILRSRSLNLVKNNRGCQIHLDTKFLVKRPSSLEEYGDRHIDRCPSSIDNIDLPAPCTLLHKSYRIVFLAIFLKVGTIQSPWNVATI